MNQTCPRCQSRFTTSPQALELYKKIDPSLPEPTLCPSCRQQNRLAYRNESTLYKRPCDLCNKPIIATYHDQTPFPVYCQSCFWSDKWSALDYGQDYDESKAFFPQFKRLSQKVPRIALVNKQSENSEYGNYAFANKNCYLIFGSHYEEDCLFSRYSTKNKDCTDYFWLYGSELCYEAAFSANCYRCIFIERLEDCSECYFCFDLKNCQNCLFSTGLRNKQYYIFNQQKTKEEYENYLQSIQLSSADQWQKLREGWLKYRRENAIFRAVYQTNCENCEGSNLQNSKNLKHCFSASDCEDCAYGFQMDQTYSSVDNSHTGYDRCELLYNTVGHNGSFHCICTDSCWHSNDLSYSNLCFSSRDCFGSIGLRQNQYCIFNKQYSKEEYEKLSTKIREQMIANKEWGQFFPESPYAYNETVAQDFYPLTKEQALEKGFQWRENIDQVEGHNNNYQIPDDISAVQDDILDHILYCKKTQRPYKLVKKELEFYRKQNIPIPRLCPQERARERFILANLTNTLYQSKCSNCQSPIQTTINPKSNLKVYCEPCYLKTTY